MRRDIYERITHKIIEDLERGVRPWHRPWSGSGGVTQPLRGNFVPYRGVNILTLWAHAMDNGFFASVWMTFKQAQELGGHVRKGERGAPVGFASSLTRSEVNPENGEEAANSVRPAGLAGSSGQFLEEEFRHRAEEAVRSAVQEIAGEVISTGHINYKDAPGSPIIDFFYTTTPKPPRPKPQTIAVLIVGPYQNKTLYRKRRFDWMLRAFGLAWSYDHVVLVLPSKKHVADYNAWILQYQQTVIKHQLSNSKTTIVESQARGPRVHVISVEIQNMDSKDEAAIASFSTIA